MKKSSFSNMTAEERAEMGRKGGINSGISRRKKAAMKETLELLLELPLHSDGTVTAEDVKSFADLKGKNIDIQTAILVAQIQKALRGSVASAEFLRDTAGERPEDIINLNAGEEDTSLNINISYGNTPKEGD